MLSRRVSCCACALAGAIAQLGERLLCKQEVVGSIPSGSTILAWSAGSSGSIIGSNIFGSSVENNSATVMLPSGDMRARDI